MITLEFNKLMKNILDKQEDVVFVIDGKEKKGMSCLSTQISKFINNSQQKSQIATDKNSRALLDNVSEGSRPKRPQQLEEGSADKLKLGGTHREI